MATDHSIAAMRVFRAIGQAVESSSPEAVRRALVAAAHVVGIDPARILEPIIDEPPAMRDREITIADHVFEPVYGDDGETPLRSAGCAKCGTPAVRRWHVPRLPTDGNGPVGSGG